MIKFVERIKEMDDYLELGGVAENDICTAESKLNLTFAREYYYYLLNCGLATADGHEFTGLGNSQRLNVVNVTKRLKKENIFVPKDFYVIEELCVDKIVIWQCESGEIYQTMAASEPMKIADSIYEYLE